MTEEIKKENININIDNTKNEEENKNQNIDNKITIEEENENFLNKIILNKYKIIKKIRRGSQAQIYLGENIKTLEQFAIKVEKNKTENCLLKNEIYILGNLQNTNSQKKTGIVEMYNCLKYKDYLILIEKLLGNSLDLLFLNLSKKFSLLDICQIALQSIDRIEYVHSKGIIHCDIKPENFVIGIDDPNFIYLIDFGLGQKYISLKTGKHIEFKFTGYMTGTARYASRNALRGKCLSRRDDIESFMYMILFFLAKKLPWQGLKAKNLGEKYKKIYTYKKEFNYKSFCKNYPSEITNLFEYVYSLSFTEKPSYQYMREMFNKILEQNNLFINDFFSWMDKKQYDDIINDKRRALSEKRNKYNENKKMIRTSITGNNLKESTTAINNLRLSRLNSNSKLVLSESNNEEIINNLNINNDIENINEINNEKIIIATPSTPSASMGRNIKQKLEKYPDDEEEKKVELKKELDVIKEEENEDEYDIDGNTKKVGGSVHLYKIDINEFKFTFENKNNINNNSLTKSNIVLSNEKNDIKTKLIGKSHDHINNSKKESNKNLENEINIDNNIKKEVEESNQNNININIINIKEPNNNINIIHENEIQEEKNEIKETNTINTNTINNKEENINKENTNEIHNTITLTQIKPDNMFISEYDLVQKIKQGTQNLVPKKVVFKKKFKNEGNIKYSSISSLDFQKKKGYFSTTQRRNMKNKVAEALDGKNDDSHNKNKNCNVF